MAGNTVLAEHLRAEEAAVGFPEGDFDLEVFRARMIPRVPIACRSTGDPAHGNPAPSYLVHPSPRGSRERSGSYRHAAPGDRPSGIPDAGRPTVTQTLTSQLITVADDSATWDWHVTYQDALATWVRESPNPIRTIRVTLTDNQNLGPATVGVGYPSGKDQAAIAHAACDGKPDMTCRTSIKQDA